MPARIEVLLTSFCYFDIQVPRNCLASASSKHDGASQENEAGSKTAERGGFVGGRAAEALPVWLVEGGD